MKSTKKKLISQSKIVKSLFQQVDVASSLSITQACLREVGKLGSAFVHCNISGSNITKYSGLNTVAKYMNRQNIVKSISSSFPTVWGDFIHEFDWIVGEIMKTLEEEKLAENTFVILTSDNGGMLNHVCQDAWTAGHRQNGRLLGFKFDAWEGGHRIPMIVRWPGEIESGSRSDQLISNVDMLSTLAALKKPNMALRKGKWVFIGAQGGGGFSAANPGDHMLGGPAAFRFTGEINSDIEDGKIKPGAPSEQLYNLENDLYQSRNVIREHPDIANQMRDMLKQIELTKETRHEK